MSKFNNLFNSIITEGRAIYTFQDWVDWILTVQEGQAVTFTSTEAFKETHSTLDQPGSIIGNFIDAGTGPGEGMDKERLLKKTPITAHVTYEDDNGNKQGGHISVYQIRPIGARGPRYK
jgi:hypothetical protein